MKLVILCPMHGELARRVFMAVPIADAEKMRTKIITENIDNGDFLTVEAETPGEIQDPRDLQRFLYRVEYAFGVVFNAEFGNDEVSALEWEERTEKFIVVDAKDNPTAVKSLQKGYPWVDQFLTDVAQKAKDAADFQKQF